MELLVNDLSLSGQYPDVSSFRDAVVRIMRIRELARRFGRTLYCHRGMSRARVTRTLSLPQAVQALERNEQRALMQWLTQYGPFWEDAQHHTSDDYLECKGQVVTDTAVGEAAYLCLLGVDRHLVSFRPSAWQWSPIPVDWKTGVEPDRSVEVANHWDVEEIQTALRTAPVFIESWQQLARASAERFDQLTFAADCFTPLAGIPFSHSAALRALVLLDTLNNFRACFDAEGCRTAEGNRLYQDHFTGGKAWFTDSSDSEKVEFASELDFAHPDRADETLFCTWHGKIKTPQLRIHFSWPVTAVLPVYVVYAGPKITKR